MSGGGGGQQRIEFALDAGGAADALTTLLEQERERRRRRADKFQVEYIDPAAQPQWRAQARREARAAQGFVTGDLDLLSAEEQAKRAARAVKFGLPEERQAPLYGPDPEEAKRRARAAKFGVAYQPPRPETVLQAADLLEPRKDAPAEVPRRETAIYLYGVDCMSTADCMAYFDEYGPQVVEWINDSACCVVFADAATTRRAIAGKGVPLPPEELSSAPDDMDEAMPGGLDPVTSVQQLWHKGREFTKPGLRPVKLLYRLATDLDQKDPHADRRTRELWKPPGKRRYEQAYADGDDAAWQGDHAQAGPSSSRGGARGARSKRARMRGDEETAAAAPDEEGAGEDARVGAAAGAPALADSHGQELEFEEVEPEPDPASSSELELLDEA